MNKERILVTGGAGFIGSHLCRYLLNQDKQVICLDNFSTGSRENIADLFKYAKFEFIYHDIIDPAFIEVDKVYNLACPASPKHYQKNPVRTIKTNVMGTINLLGLARRKQARILQASTSEVYGDPLEHPQKEVYLGNVNPIGIRACYDEGKRIAESLFFEYHRVHEVDIRVVRIFNTFGPFMAEGDGRVISNFILQAINNENITIYGDGSQTRSFCYIDDLVKALVLMMEQDFHGPINIGNPYEITIKRLAEEIVTMTGSSSQIVCLDLPADDPKLRCPDISLARKVLNWSPEISFEAGLQKTIEYYLKRKC